MAAAVEIAKTSDIANHHAYVWEMIRGVGHPYLIEPLLQSLAYDASDYVRRMAALTLGDFRDEPRVLATLGGRKSVTYPRRYRKPQGSRCCPTRSETNSP